MRLGFHLSVAGGPQRAAREALEMGLGCLQIFAGSPRSWRHKPLDQEQADRFQRLCARAGLDPVVVHAPYLLNLASPDDELWQRSVAALAEQMERARLLGARAVVVHPGSRRGRGLDWGLARVARGVSRALEHSRGQVECWLENTAGGGGQVGGTLSQLALILERLAGMPAAVCLDTAHAWGAGYRLDGPRPLARFLDRVEALLGLERVCLWHLNDSLAPRGSHRDQHTHLGRGGLGKEGVRAVVSEPRLQEAAFIMETPKDRAGADRRNLAFLQGLINASRRNS